MTGRLLPALGRGADLHPMLVHFPVVLFPLALLFLLISRRRPEMIGPARLVLLLAVVSLVPAALAGLHAEDRMAHGPGSPVAVHRTVMLTVSGMAVIAALIAFAERKRATVGLRKMLIGWLALLNLVLIVGADRGAAVSLSLRAGDVHGLSASIVSSLVLPPRPGAPAGDRAPSGDPVQGRLLYDRLACDACHGPEVRPELPGLPPSLAYSGSKLRPEWTRRYLLHPFRMRWAESDVRPTVRMPDFGLDSLQAADLAAFLAGRRDTLRFSPDSLGRTPFTAQEAAEGNALVAQYSCRGCHVINGTGARLGPPLDGVGDRLRPEYIYAFLKSPRGIIPGTPMPDFELWNDEARNLSAYLSSLRAPAPPDSGEQKREAFR